MSEKQLKPRQALNKAFLKIRPNRTDIETFKSNLIQLLDTTNDTETEEFHKNLVSDFLKKTYYDPNHFINTKGRNDLVIHNGSNSKTTVGVIIEAKKPGNKAEMITAGKLNAKALQELVLYYLRERITAKNLEIKHLIVCNIYEWFVFDAAVFEKLFAQNKKLVQQFTDFEEGRLSGTKTDFFYKEIAAPFINAHINDIEFAYFDIRHYDAPLRNNNPDDDNKLIALYKLLSPEHLLKLPFANDSNSLDKQFYNELLHIIGLVEVKEKSKKLIKRNKKGERNYGSILENAITQLDALDKINRLQKPKQYGETYDEQLFSVGLELVISWVNRILFLKLLEAQLIAYNKDKENFSFLSSKKLAEYDDLNLLFFRVLARKPDERREDIQKAYANIPYLNSSLFDPTDMEHDCLFISQLEDNKTIPLYNSTVLKDENGKRLTGEMDTLQYLFSFLDAYDFSSEGSEEIQEENKQLINASVLGLIFEKINGYKDGSFFTPGFITMYMSRETIRRAVIQKFADAAKTKKIKQFDKITDLEPDDAFGTIYDAIGDVFTKQQANEIINSIKICDPAVGSGHFLVSALNEMIAIKSELKILLDRKGKTLRDYHVVVENDELIITDTDGELFDYNPNNKESQRVQETLFHEKQTIIENCLFGVDININSVKICRLRLWIELLKNAYYKDDGLGNLSAGNFPTSQTSQTVRQLETLPNIDINIKCGNSLISRFNVKADLKKIARSSKWNIFSYQNAVKSYKEVTDKNSKRELERFIDNIKSNYKETIQQKNPKLQKYYKLKQEFDYKFPDKGLFASEPEIDYGGSKKRREQEKQRLEDEIKAIKQEIENEKHFFETNNAFEWRFEFPEVLNEDGDFIGFDVVIGNPPYISFQDVNKREKGYYSNKWASSKGKYDLYLLFIELSEFILIKQGICSLIFPNKFINSEYGKITRSIFLSNQIIQILNFNDIQVFDDATTYPSITIYKKDNTTNDFKYFSFTDINEFMTNKKSIVISPKKLSSDIWYLVDNIEKGLINKLYINSIELKQLSKTITQGLRTGALNIYYDINKIKDIEKKLLVPILHGKNVKKYQTNINEDDKILYPYDNDFKPIIIDKFPNAKKYLEMNKDKLLQRKDSGKEFHQINKDYFEYWDNKPITKRLRKIVFPDISKENNFYLDDNGIMYLNTCYGIFLKDESMYEYILSVLNSKVTYYYIKNTCPSLRGGYFRYKTSYISKIPIKQINKSEQQPFIDKVNTILSAKKADPQADTAQLEHEIDVMVYKLYELSYEEVLVVDPEFAMNKKEYEEFEI